MMTWSQICKYSLYGSWLLGNNEYSQSFYYFPICLYGYRQKITLKTFAGSIWFLSVLSCILQDMWVFQLETAEIGIKQVCKPKGEGIILDYFSN